MPSRVEQQFERLIHSITLSAHNAKTSIVSADEGRVICEPKRAGVAIMAFGSTRTEVSLFQGDPA